MMEMTGAQIVMRLLERQGIECIAGIPGGANLPLYDALKFSTIKHILARHEQGAGFIAQGMARVTGQPAVCFGTSGPGATNLLTAIADARLDSVPLIAITGQVPRAMIGTDAFQEIDTYGLTLPITKHNYLVRTTRELLEVIPAAFRIATSGRPGPVVVDIPKDVQNGLIEVGEWPEPGRPDPAPGFDSDQIRRMLEMIAAAHRPVLYVGGGAITSESCDLLRQLAEKTSLPVVSTLMGLGAIPTDHPLFLGMLGMHAARFTNLVLEECDLLIGSGVRFDDRATGKVAQFCPNAGVIHIDIDESELGKIKKPTLSIHSDLRSVLEAVLPQLPVVNRTDWLARVAELKESHPLLIPGADDAMQPYGLILKAAALLNDDAIISTDVGQHQMWTAQIYPFRKPRQLLTSGGLGTMGFGLPAAIGAALAKPDRTVVCFSGDGSLLMNIQELATLAEHRLNVKVILMNNGHLGLVRQQQELFYGARFSAAQFVVEPDFVTIARGFGVEACDLGKTADPAGALGALLGQPGPALINVPIAAEEKVFPMVPPGAANREMIGGENHVVVV
jgi:acetolactate synthase I/II/III large subunit